MTADFRNQTYGALFVRIAERHFPLKSRAATASKAKLPWTSPMPRSPRPDQDRSHRVRGRCGCPEAEFSVTRLLLQTARIRGSESRHLQHLIAEASPRPSEYPPLVLMTGLLDGGISLLRFQALQTLSLLGQQSPPIHNPLTRISVFSRIASNLRSMSSCPHSERERQDHVGTVRAASPRIWRWFSG